MRFLVIIFSAILIISCKPEADEPAISLAAYHIEDGFELGVVASEPLIEAPVAIDFDEQGRIWVAEMIGYMQDLEGLSEELPNGRITILEDLDQDGVMDRSHVFLDGLVLPRAVRLAYGGLLYVEPPNLWFVEINDLKPGKKTLVDSTYSPEGNVEHQPNGLLINIDNWIYNANSNFRYRLKNDQWLKEPTTHRGQWGISKDNFGRLYYNNNSILLQGDLVLPNTFIQNKNYRPKYGVNQLLTENQKVFPLHSSSVNRGYLPGVLDKDSILIDATSACGPLIYRGGQFGAGFEEDAFVCIPEGNLIKHLKLSRNNLQISATPAKIDTEFLAATDEAFRPVNLNNGPDGNLYVVDMHRGVVQHRAYMTSYLKKHIQQKQLDTIMGMGRILKIKRKNDAAPALVKFENNNLVSLLAHPNGWVRDHAQHKIIYQKEVDKIPELVAMAKENSNPIAQVHALWALEGLDALSFEDLKNIATGGSETSVVNHCLQLLNKMPDQQYLEEMESLAELLISKNNADIALHLVQTLGTWSSISPKTFFPYLSTLSERYKEDRVMQEAIIVGLSGSEAGYMDFIDGGEQKENPLLNQMLATTLTNRQKEWINPIFTKSLTTEDGRTHGLKLYRKICSACHGQDGAGIEQLAPPLDNSEYVKGPVERLGLVILHGLKGPIHVNGKKYDFKATMPGLIANEQITDKDIADIVNFLRNAFSDSFKGASPEMIQSLREAKPKDFMYTEEELADWLKQKKISQ
ncbi:c-type cytochrome [Fulvivirgaceae bacterium BMA12]|uniref:C-type cytochrome n=1 Tax=Agaribacillus aureus TaxID=3051825 RepID=A0ABT8LCF7_9BACT|nr:c-type cytochrome [Fulvivirgaceae bacterium BMA12]